MTILAAIRHGPTDWSPGSGESGESRLQGRTDVPLSAAGIARVRSWRLPAELAGYRWLCSPLRRAQQTAALLGLEPVIEPRLVEMAWGDWEGRTLSELRADCGSGMSPQEQAGLDLQPPGGESPRQVQARLAPLLREIAAAGNPTGIITHKGVIRAIFAAAAGWDMKSKPRPRLDWNSAQLFALEPDGTPRILQLNLSLVSRFLASLSPEPA